MHAILSSFLILLLSAPLTLAADLAALPEVACRYEMKVSNKADKHTAQPKSWYFWRTGSMIQTRDADGGRGEVWELTNKGFVAYRKLYHQEKTAVETAPADRPVSGKTFDWYQLATMLTEQDLKRLKVSQRKKIQGEDAEIREGTLHGEKLKVAWLTQLQLPAWIKKTVRGETRLLELKELKPFGQSPWQPTSIETVNAYRQIDSTDFGDMENDPFVKKLLHESGHHHAH